MSSKESKKRKKRYTSPTIKSVSEKGLTRSIPDSFASPPGPCTPGLAETE